MTVTHTEAAAALRDIDAAREQSRAYFHYRHASSYLLLWGALWVVVGVVSDLAPARTGNAWLTADVIGGATSIWIARLGLQRMDQPAARRWIARYLTSVAAYVAFATISLWLMKPTSVPQASAYFALLIGALYAGVGNWVGARYLVTGVVLAAAAVTIYALDLPHATALISLAGGLAMMLGGLWMRRA